MRLIAKVVESPTYECIRTPFPNLKRALGVFLRHLCMEPLCESDVPINVRVAEWDAEGKRVHVRRANKDYGVAYLSLDPDLAAIALTSMEIESLDKEYRLRIPGRASLSSPGGTQLWLINRDGDPFELSYFKRYLLGDYANTINCELTFVSCSEYNEST
jgi:hypothetical protein